jgi:type IV pilus assembly protein PilE
MKLQKGFTLIELMVTVAIVGILASIAMPLYSDYVIRGKIPEATSSLSTMRVRMEQYFLDNRTYIGFPCANNGNHNFAITCPAAQQTSISYVIQADGVGAMAGFTYTVNEANVQATTAAPSGWGPVSATCWITKKGGVC